MVWVTQEGKPMVKKDCFAFDGRRKGCRALKVLCCSSCNFYKTQNDNEHESMLAYNRIEKQLPAYKRNKILRTYYGYVKLFGGN